MPILDRPWIAVVGVVYLAAVTAIGVWSLGRTRDERDFFIAGQRIGLWVTALATMSAAFSGFVFLGGPGLAYRIGAASLWIVAPVGFTGGLLCWTVARRLRALAGVADVLTVPDAVAARFGDRPAGRAAAGLAAAAIVVGAVGYLGAQLLALGTVIEAVFGTRELLGGWSLPVAMAAGTAVVLFYSAAGGMVAGVYTDLVQGALMMAAALAVFAAALAAGGGPGAMVAAIAGSERFGPGFVDPLGTVPAATAFGFFLVFGVGVLGQPQMLHKFYMLRDPEKLRWMPLVLGGSQVVCLLIWLGVGLAVPALVAGGRMAPLARPDDAAPAFLLGFAPDWLSGLVLAGILAAVMSTADSFANLGAAALVRDLPRAFGRPAGDGRGGLGRARAATVALTVAAAVVAWLYDDLIALLGTFAFGTFAAALAPALAVGLGWRRVTAAAAAASIAAGGALNLGLELAARQTLLPGLGSPLPPGVPPSAVALAASFTVLFAVTGWDVLRRGLAADPPLPEEIRAALDEPALLPGVRREAS